MDDPTPSPSLPRLPPPPETMLLSEKLPWPLKVGDEDGDVNVGWNSSQILRRNGNEAGRWGRSGDGCVISFTCRRAYEKLAMGVCGADKAW